MATHYFSKSAINCLDFSKTMHKHSKMLPFIKQKCKNIFISTGRSNSLCFKFLVVLLLVFSSLLNLSSGASLHHKENRSAGLFALNNFTDLYDASSTAQASASSSIKSMDLTSVELNSIDVGEFDPASSSRNLQLGTKENTVWAAIKLFKKSLTSRC